MTTLSNVVCSVIHRNVIYRFMVQALQDPPFCSSTISTLHLRNRGSGVLHWKFLTCQKKLHVKYGIPCVYPFRKFEFFYQSLVPFR
jgi:hypothetical protein